MLKYKHSELIQKIISDGVQNFILSIEATGHPDYSETVVVNGKVSVSWNGICVDFGGDFSPDHNRRIRYDFEKLRYPKLPGDDLSAVAKYISNEICKEVLKKLKEQPPAKDSDIKCGIEGMKMYYTAQNGYFKGMNSW